MKLNKILPLCLVYAAAVTLIAWGMAGCSLLSEETTASGAAVAQLWSEINADGVVTEEEGARYLEAFNAWYGHLSADVGGINWEELAYTIGGAASVAFIGVNVFRNRVQGKGGFITPKV